MLLLCESLQLPYVGRTPVDPDKTPEPAEVGISAVSREIDAPDTDEEGA